LLAFPQKRDGLAEFILWVAVSYCVLKVFDPTGRQLVASGFMVALATLLLQLIVD
jgi:hypothetical protein